MTITLTKNENGYDLAATGLPAPLTITDAVAKALAAALVSDDIVNPVAAFGGIDKLVWSPQTREPIGLWVTGEAKVQFWIAGQTTDLTKDEAAQLALTVLLAGATHAVGDEVEVISGYELVTHENGAPNEPTTSSHRGGSLGKIAEIYYSDLQQRVAYKVDFGDTNGALAPDVIDAYIKRPDPIQKWEVVQDGRIDVSRSVIVEARNETQAKVLANEEFKAMGAQKGWSEGRVENHGITDVVNLGDTDDTFDQNNAAEGFSATAAQGIVAVDGGFNNSDNAAYRFVVEKALAGSPRHRRALKIAHEL